MGVVCYVHMLIVVFLSIHTVPYIIYVHSLIVVSLIAFFLSMHLVYMLTCRLSFSYLYISYIIFSLVDCRFLLMHPYAYAHSLIVVSHRCITYVYAQTLIVLYLQFLFQYPSIDIDKCLSYARQMKCNDKTDRRCIVVSMLCK